MVCVEACKGGSWSLKLLPQQAYAPVEVMNISTKEEFDSLVRGRDQPFRESSLFSPAAVTTTNTSMGYYIRPGTATLSIRTGSLSFPTHDNREPTSGNRLSLLGHNLSIG